LKILVVDDDRLSRRILEMDLKKKGHDVISAENGEIALNLLKSDMEISLVITDWNMPVMDGLELCRKSRELIRKRYLPMILLTSRGEKEDLIAGLNAGADAFLSKPLNSPELQAHLKVVGRNLDLEKKLSDQIEEIKLAHIELQKANVKIEDIARHDGLTGLFNRRYVMERLEAEMIRSRLQGTPLGVIIIDIDHFKKVNDQFGHLMGDKVLRETSQVMQSNARPDDILGRYGGEEFLGVFPNTVMEGLLVIADRIRLSVQNNPIQLDTEESLNIKVSIGMACFKADRDTSTTLLSRADEALYEAKKNGRNQVCFR